MKRCCHITQVEPILQYKLKDVTVHNVFKKKCWCRTGIISYPFSAALTSNPALPAGPFLIADLKLSHLYHTFICVNMEETSHILHNMYYIIILSLILTPLQNSPKKVI